MDKYINFMFGILGSVTTYAFGGWNNWLELLLILTVLDFVTGIMASTYESLKNPNHANKGLSSKKGSFGIAKKALMFTVIFVMYRIDEILGLNGTLSLAVGATFFYISNELLSLAENYGRLSLPMPSQMKKAITILKNKSGENSDSKETKKNKE